MTPSRPFVRRLPELIRRALLLFGAAASLSVARSAAAQTPRPQDDSLRVYLLTMGQGDEIWELFGHDAIWVHDPRQAMDTVYNWGVFDFGSPHFILHFMEGDNRYTMTGDPLDAIIQFYRQLDRDVWAQELDLTAAEKKTLVDYVHWNLLPANAPYGYNYYLDNCATRVRNVLDRAVNGRLRPQLAAIRTDQTYRDHSLRLMQHSPALAAGVDLLLGRPTDHPLTADEASFLPGQLMHYIRAVKVDGHPLVRSEFQVIQSTRTPEPARRPHTLLWFLPIGILLAALILWLGAGEPSVGRRRAAATAVAIIAGLIGILGLIIAGLVTMTHHVAARYNENAFLLNPLWIVVAVIGPLAMLRQGTTRRAALVIRVSAAIACLAVLIHLIGLSRQPNWDAIGLLLPAELAIAWVSARRIRVL